MPVAARVDAARGAGGAAVDVRDLHLSFGDSAVLRGVDLHVPPGSVTAVLGPSGEGKTSLLRCLAGFVAPHRGTVEVGGRLLTGPGTLVPPEDRQVGVVPQEGALFPHLDVGRNVAFGLPRGRAARSRVGEVLELVGLAGFERRAPGELSGGQQQRVALARALAPQPAVVLLDEPFSALDAGLRAALREDVRAALSASGTTGVLVTHDQDEALSVADHVAVLRGGRVVQAAAPVDLYRRPVDLAVATFVGEAVVLPGEVRGAVASTVLGELALDVPAAAGSADVVVRPEQLRLGGPGPGETPGSSTPSSTGTTRPSGSCSPTGSPSPPGACSRPTCGRATPWA